MMIEVYLVYAIVLGLLMGLIRLLKSTENTTEPKCVARNLLVAGLVGGLVFWLRGYQPIEILGMAYFADDFLWAILERYKDKSQTGI